MKEQKLKMLSVDFLEVNTGQIDNVPSNPRLINEERMAALKKSISELPDMLALRELIVYPLNGKYVILCGNMRYEACVELGFTEVPCKVLSSETPSEVMRRIVMVDNEEFGKTDWEAVSREWNIDELKDWGIEMSTFFGATDDGFELDSFFDSINNEDEKSKDEKLTITIPSEYADQKDEMKSLIESALSDYSGIKVK